MEETEVNEGSKDEEGVALEQMKRIKAVGPDDDSAVAWKVLEHTGNVWLTVVSFWKNH